MCRRRSAGWRKRAPPFRNGGRMEQRVAPTVPMNPPLQISPRPPTPAPHRHRPSAPRRRGVRSWPLSHRSATASSSQLARRRRRELRRLQRLLRRGIPSGDPAVIFDKALDLLLARVQNRKEGAVSKPKPAGLRALKARVAAARSRRVPAATRRVVVPRDGGQCTFIATNGRRCTAVLYLEFHHAGVPFARGGGPGADNIALHCRAHNAWEGRRVFGDHLPREVREARVQYDAMLAEDARRAAVPGTAAHGIAALQRRKGRRARARGRWLEGDLSAMGMGGARGRGGGDRSSEAAALSRA